MQCLILDLYLCKQINNDVARATTETDFLYMITA